MNPVDTKLVGYSALISYFDINHTLSEYSCTNTKKNKLEKQGNWKIFEKKMECHGIYDNLWFAIKHENIDLLLFKKIFAKINKQELTNKILNDKNSKYSRKIWFLYEFLMNENLSIDTIDKLPYEDFLDNKKYFVGESKLLPRYYIKNNLLGNSEMCPIVRKTENLMDMNGRFLSTEAKEIMKNENLSVIERACSYMILADSQASYQIEKENPTQNKLERWMKIVKNAGQSPLSIKELERFQKIILDDNSFVKKGIRKDNGFIGTRQKNGNPVPEFISAKHQDLDELMKNWFGLHQKLSSENIDPIVHAALISFSFVFIHPFEDGNGRLHRYLIHHVLSEKKFQENFILPISDFFKNNLLEYSNVLKKFTSPLLNYMEWEVTETQNVRVLNDTIDMYRYGDYTDLVEFLYKGIKYTIENSLPNEIDFLKKYDQMSFEINEKWDMKSNDISLLIQCVHQNNGKLSKGRRKKTFEKLTDEDVVFVEELYQNIFNTDDRDNIPDID